MHYLTATPPALSTVPLGAVELCTYSEYVDGPHPGCAEFAPPDFVECRGLATTALVVKDVDWASGVGTSTTIVLLCTGHGAELASDLTVDPTAQLLAVVSAPTALASL